MNYLSEIKRLSGIRDSYRDLLNDKGKLKSYIKANYTSYFAGIRDLRQKFEILNSNIFDLENSEKLRREEQAFLSRHTGRIVKSCRLVPMRGGGKVYNYSFGTLHYDRKKICVELNGKSYVFEDKSDIDFIFTLFKRKKELIGKVYDEIPPLKK